MKSMVYRLSCDYSYSRKAFFQYIAVLAKQTQFESTVTNIVRLQSTFKTPLRQK